MRRRSVEGVDGFDVRVPEDYARTIPNIAGLGRCKPVLTPFAEKGMTADVDVSRVLDATEKSVFRTIIG
eukprot:381273-Heterocapsa_arctica.AAC.1